MRGRRRDSTLRRRRSPSARGIVGATYYHVASVSVSVLLAALLGDVLLIAALALQLRHLGEEQ